MEFDKEWAGWIMYDDDNDEYSFKPLLEGEEGYTRRCYILFDETKVPEHAVGIIHSHPAGLNDMRMCEMAPGDTTLIEVGPYENKISKDDINTLVDLDMDLGIMIDEDGMTYFSQTSDTLTLEGDNRYGRCGR